MLSQLLVTALLLMLGLACIGRSTSLGSPRKQRLVLLGAVSLLLGLILGVATLVRHLV